MPRVSFFKCKPFRFLEKSKLLENRFEIDLTGARYQIVDNVKQELVAFGKIGSCVPIFNGFYCLATAVSHKSFAYLHITHVINPREHAFFVLETWPVLLPMKVGLIFFFSETNAFFCVLF